MKSLRLLFLLPAMLFLSHASASPLQVGDAAPAVIGTTDTGDSLDFAATYAKGYTLVYFYPKADTPGCTAQGCSLRDAYEALGKKGVTVIGVSADSVEAQKKFREKYNLPFTLIADTEKVVITGFGVPTRDIPLVGSLASRQAFLVNKAGKIVWADFKASTAQQAQDVLAALEKLGD